MLQSTLVFHRQNDVLPTLQPVLKQHDVFTQPCGFLFYVEKHDSRANDIYEVQILEIIQFNACMDGQIAIKKWKESFIENLSHAGHLLNSLQHYMRYEI
jgi:hypothetical protein